VAGIDRIGKTLAEHFPLAPGSEAHPNELPDGPV
jgi:uncharacterized membrane protein